MHRRLRSSVCEQPAVSPRKQQLRIMPQVGDKSSSLSLPLARTVYSSTAACRLTHARYHFPQCRFSATFVSWTYFLIIIDHYWLDSDASGFCFCKRTVRFKVSKVWNKLPSSLKDFFRSNISVANWRSWYREYIDRYWYRQYYLMYDYSRVWLSFII